MVTLSQLSKMVALSPSELERKIEELGFTLQEQGLEDDVAELLVTELKKGQDKAHVYQEIFEREREKEIIKSQRKKTAGKLDALKTKKTKKVEEQKVQKEAAERSQDGVLEIPELISVKEFAEKTGISPVKIIGELMKNGILANINQQIDFETASIIAADFHIPLRRRRSEVSLADLEAANLEAFLKDEETDLQSRPPVVTVMGHVDHGKSKLLETIREVEMLSLEAGGITQHIGAYQVVKNGRKITFLDTPGHEAFTAMRARGAKVTDIAILVVAADEGIKPQTIEALNHAKDANVPIIVALNKIDKEGANVDRVKAQLAEQGLLPEDWGGKTIMVPLSALTGEGIPTLLEMILLVADMENLRANSHREAVGTVIEAHLDKSLGAVATIVVNTGTLRVGDHIVVGSCFGRVKIMRDHLGKPLKEAPPSTPAQIAGLSSVPLPGSILQVVKNDQEARQRASAIENMRKAAMMRKGDALKSILAQISAGKLKTLKVVLKADTTGSLEAIHAELSKIKHEDVSVKVIHSGVGNITETDIMMAKASHGVVVGFHTTTPPHARKIAESEGIQIFTYTIIYKLADDIKSLLAGLLEPEVIILELGKAEVKKIFYSAKKEMIIGCRVASGKLETRAYVRIIREGKNIGEGIISSLKRTDENVSEVSEGHECGVKFAGPVKLEEGDILEAWKQETKKRTL